MMTVNANPPTLPRLSSFLRAPSASSSSPPPAPSVASATTAMPSSTSPLMVRPMRRGSLTQTLYDQTQCQFSQSLYIHQAPAAASSVLLRTNSSSSLQEDIRHSQQQQRLRLRKRKSTSQDSLFQQHSNSSSGSTFQFPSRPAHASQAPDSKEFTRSASFSALYDSVQARSQQDESRDSTRDQSFSWKQQTSSPISTGSTQQEQIITDNSSSHPAQQRERTSRYLSEGDRRAIISRIEHGEKQVTLAKEYCVSRAAICNLYKNRKEVLTRVDRDPEAKHPKKQRPKKSSATTSLVSGIESPQSAKSAAAHAVSPSSSPADEEEDLDEQQEEEKVKPELERPQRHQQIPFDRATTTLVRMQRTFTTEDFSGPMETVQLPSSSSSPSLASRVSSSSASTTARGGALSPASTLELHRRIKPFLVHEALVYSLPIKKLLCSLRNVETRSTAFRHQADRVMRLIVEEALGCLPQVETDIITPYGDSIPGIVPTDEREICAISMEGQQEQVLLRAFADVQPLSSTGVLSLSPADANGSNDWQIHAQLPPVRHDQVVLLLDLFCGTGERACSALNYLIREARINPSRIYFVTVNAALPGLQRVHHYFPDVSLITAQMDKVVDTQGRIRPGVGDFLERYWNCSYRQELAPITLHMQSHGRRHSHHYQSQR